MKTPLGRTDSAISRLLKGCAAACAAAVLAFARVSVAQSALPHHPDGDGHVTISGELRQWHRVTLDLTGPFAHEMDTDPNPFTDYRLTVTSERIAENTGFFDFELLEVDMSRLDSLDEQKHLGPDPANFNF